jgi:hypothetical protein
LKNFERQTINFGKAKPNSEFGFAFPKFEILYILLKKGSDT